MSINTFATLKTSITSWTKRADLTSVLDDFVLMAESRIFSDLKVIEMEARADYTPTSRYLATPTGLTSIRRIVAKSSPPVELMATSPDGLRTVYDEGSGTPSHYAILGSEIEFNRIPNVDVEIVYYAAPTALSDVNTTNAILTAYPQIYLAACMVQAGLYIVNDAMVAKWQGLYADAVSAANRKSSKFQTAGPMATVSA